jgi:hypothetical protein
VRDTYVAGVESPDADGPLPLSVAVFVGVCFGVRFEALTGED